MKKKKGLQASYPLWVALPTALVYTVFTIVPLLMSLGLSFTDWHIKRLDNPVFRGFDNYVAVFQDPIFVRSIGNTLIFAIGTALLKVVFGLALALLLKESSKPNNVLRTVYYTPCVLSITVIGVLFSSILANDGLLNNTLRSIGLDSITMAYLTEYQSAMVSVIFIEGWMWAGYNMFILISGLQAIPVDYYEYASTEGVSKWHQFIHITVPLLVPSFTVVFTLNITGGLKVFDMIYVLTGGGPGFDTQVVSTYTYRAFSSGLLGQSAASSMVLCVIVMVLTFAFNKFLRSKEVEA